MAMVINDKSRVLSFTYELVGKHGNMVTELFQRIDASDLPGEYDVDFVSLSLNNGQIQSVTIYFLEPKHLDSQNKIKQRRDALDYYATFIPDLGIVLTHNNLPIRVDPSFKSLDDISTLRIDPQFRAVGLSCSECLDKFVRTSFPHCASIVQEASNRLGIPWRFAAEYDIPKKRGRKLRLYYYDNLEKGEAIRGLTYNSDGKITSTKNYYGVFGRVGLYQAELERFADKEYLKKLISQDFYSKYDMTFKFFAREKANYDVDCKMYFVNNQVERA